MLPRVTPAPQASTSSTTPSMLVMAIIGVGVFVVLMAVILTALKCRQRRQKLQRVQAQVAQSSFKTDLSRLSLGAVSASTDTEGYLQPVRGRRTSPQPGAAPGHGGMARAAGPSEDYRGYLQPVRSGAGDSRTGFVSNAAFGGVDATLA